MKQSSKTLLFRTSFFILIYSVEVRGVIESYLNSVKIKSFQISYIWKFILPDSPGPTVIDHVKIQIVRCSETNKCAIKVKIIGQIFSTINITSALITAVFPLHNITCNFSYKTVNHSSMQIYSVLLTAKIIFKLRTNILFILLLTFVRVFFSRSRDSLTKLHTVNILMLSL